VADDGRPPVPKLSWEKCGVANPYYDSSHVECTTATVPRDYSRPGHKTVKLFVAKSPATGARKGSLFINFGGPGGSAADAFQFVGAGLFPGLNEHFDIIAMDPRGVGQSEPSIDCKANQQTEGVYSMPFATPLTDPTALISKDRDYINKCVSLNRDILPYVSTANVARDIDLLRQALGEKQITYFGFSYGTFLGATYASLFPKNYRAMVLDGPMDADSYINHPLDELSAQSAGFERALGRFLQWCKSTACGFGGGDPIDAYDQLVERANDTPIPSKDGGRAVTGDDILNATAYGLYSKRFWSEIGDALAAADAGDGSAIRALSDSISGLNPDGTFNPGTDRYFTIGAIEQRYPRDISTYFQAGKRSWSEHQHFWWNNGYVELNYGLFPIRAMDAYYGPFRIRESSVTPLVVATTYDPATPYRGALNLVRDLDNATLVTMRGDGHTAYGGESQCVDSAVEAYINDGTLPAKDPKCVQGDTQPAANTMAVATPASQSATIRRLARRPGMGVGLLGLLGLR
jgi:pimeloyl-ACP methyl ester carboxylesterase